MGKEDVEISHLQFADDTQIVGDVFASNTIIMKSIFRWFELILGFKVNFFKS